jgi:hypothetical protein
VENLLESFLGAEGFLSSGWLFPDFWLAFPSCTQVVEGDMIVGGAVGFHLIALLLPGDDDIASVPAGVEVARLMLVLFWYVLLACGTLGVPELMSLFLDVIFIFDLHGSHSVESMYK